MPSPRTSASSEAEAAATTRSPDGCRRDPDPHLPRAGDGHRDVGLLQMDDVREARVRYDASSA
ncbi:hypothetical protein [Actinomadura latina]|uniref:Uncharacterized protein n=1 Tax=Actinomadura latina TaxID=163603 RepID=A0A846YS63_9ACTN|nr:hypothetical protein [Actinomadura latina]NKZ03169.1 hypothetical protein [Actinomadura latina]